MVKKLWEKVKALANNCYNKLFSLLLRVVKKEVIAKWIIRVLGAIIVVLLLVLVYKERQVIINIVDFIKAIIKQ